MMLSDVTKVSQRFQRSVRVDTDLDSPASLDGFICHESNQTVLATMARLITDSGQRAFTWTGPYGGGKSSLALSLAAMVSRETRHRKQIFDQLGKPDALRKALGTGKDDWLVVPVVGRRSDPVDDIREAVSSAIASEPGRARTKKRKLDPTGRDVIGRLEDEAIARATGGVLLIVDEMGKFLEGARSDTIDIHFFQELAEAANRCDGKLIVLGILHQSFEQYASRLGRETQDEWAKVQGRFIDIPIITAVDEVIDLIGCAILRDPKQKIDRKISKTVGDAIAKRRPGSPEDLSARLEACWPLHPVTAALLGPISRGKYAQNERSVFGFLGSVEPLGFQEFLRETAATSDMLLGPDRLWDYLRANLEPAIMASPDGHRWAQGVESIERCEARGTQLHIQLAKTIAVIDLFRNGSGIMAEQAILRSCSNGAKAKEVDAALKDLASWSVTVFRNHLDAWAIYAGSDFDIHSAVEAARARNPVLDFRKLGRLAHMPPLLAKEHYYKTGTLRWFETGLVALSECENAVAKFKPPEGAAGKFLLVIPSEDNTGKECRKICANASLKAGDYPVAVGFPHNAWLLCDLGLELTALEDVQRYSPELDGDAVARRELRARLSATSARFEEDLRTALGVAEWYIRGDLKKPEDERSLSRLVSEQATQTFCDAPTIRSELINHIKPSSNSQAAVRQLLYRMIDGAGSEYLGIEGFKAERGLYSTVLEATGLHGGEGKAYGFKSPHGNQKLDKSFGPMWRAATDLLKSAKDPVSLATLYDCWTRPPFGIRQGVLPVLAMAFVLAQRDSIAIYVDDMFQPELNDVVADKLLQDARQIKLRRVSFGRQSKSYLQGLAKTIGEQTDRELQPDALSVARELVRFSFAQPGWTRRTKSVSETARKVRRVLLHASDPHQTLFVDLPLIFDGEAKSQVGPQLAEALRELGGAYPGMLSDLQRRMLKALGHKSDDKLSRLRRRAETVSGLSGDFRLDAFATRLMQFEGTGEDMESIASLAVNKPPRDWSDREPEQAALVLAEFALKFRHAEVLAGIKDREPTRHALGIVFGTGEQGHTVMTSFDIDADEEAEVEVIANKLMTKLNGNSEDHHLVLAALARVGSRLLEKEQVDDAAEQLREIVAS